MNTLLLPTLLLATTAHAAITHMNPTMKYVVSNPARGHEGESKEFSSPSFFEVDSPTLRMQYSEVAWRTLAAVDLPAEIVAKYATSSMAVTGFEVDVLRVINKATNATESVPAYQSYNHHYGVELLSSAVKLKLDAFGQATGREMGHGKILETEMREVPEGVAPPPANARLVQSFIHGNGQEHRQMFHGAPPGYVQPIYAPAQFVMTPMQISTNDGTGRKGAGGPLPKIKRAGGLTPADPAAKYSPLLECPCTTRIKKVLDRNGDGTINGAAYNGDCARAEPLSDLNATKNPTCKASWYVGKRVQDRRACGLCAVWVRCGPLVVWPMAVARGGLTIHDPITRHVPTSSPSFSGSSVVFPGTTSGQWGSEHF